MEIVQNNALITVNATLVFQLISFLILVFILHRVMIKPLRSTMEERETYIDKLEANVESGEAKLIAIEEKLNAQKKEFFSQSSNLRKQLMEEANTAGSEILSAARAKVTAELHQATQESNALADEIRKEFTALADELSGDIINKVLDRSAA